MFVLEGFRRREDLENRIDWMGKGRVLVYEKQRPATTDQQMEAGPRAAGQAQEQGAS
jgi:hypothetical protein